MMGGLIIVLSIRPISVMARYYVMGFLFQYYQFYHSTFFTYHALLLLLFDPVASEGQVS